MTNPKRPATKTASKKFAYPGLDRVIHEKARLSIMASLASHPDGLQLNDLKDLGTETDGNQTAPKVAGLTGGSFVAVWQSDAQDGSGWGIYGRSYSPAGAARSVQGQWRSARPYC